MVPVSILTLVLIVVLAFHATLSYRGLTTKAVRAHTAAPHATPLCGGLCLAACARSRVALSRSSV